jgi:hypothetical protein
VEKMKKPDKIIKYFHVDKEKDRIWVDFNGKPCYSYVIKLPYWLGRAYKLGYKWVKIEIDTNGKSMKDRIAEETKEYRKYFDENWSKKMDKMRKLNHNYLLISHKGKGTGWFKSIEDYNNYHKELSELNKKYGVK